MDSLALKLSAHVDGTPVGKVSIPGGTDMQSGGICVDTICASDTITLVLVSNSHRREPEHIRRLVGIVPGTLHEGHHQTHRSNHSKYLCDHMSSCSSPG